MYPKSIYYYLFVFCFIPRLFVYLRMRTSTSKQHSCVRGPLRECRSIRSGASGLPYYCTPLVFISAVIGLLVVWRHNKPKIKNQEKLVKCDKDYRTGPGGGFSQVGCVGMKMSRMRRRKGKRQERPRALARAPDPCAKLPRHPIWQGRSTPCSLGCAHAGHPRPFSTGVVADQGCGADSGDMQTSDSGSDTIGTFPRALPLHVLYEHAPVPCPCFACLTVLFVMQMHHKRRSCCNSRLARALRARVPCTCLHVLSLCLRVCFVLHFVDMLNCGEFPFGRHCSMKYVLFLTHTECSSSKE